MRLVEQASWPIIKRRIASIVLTQRWQDETPELTLESTDNEEAKREIWKTLDPTIDTVIFSKVKTQENPRI